MPPSIIFSTPMLPASGVGWQSVMTNHFQDVAQKFVNNKNSDSFAAHFAKHFTQKLSPQECREIMSFNILFYG